MSTLDAAHRHIRRSGAGREATLTPGRIALLVLLLGAVLGAAETHLLPTLSADDVGSISCGEGQQRACP